MRNERVSVPWLCLSVTSQATKFNHASPGSGREGAGKKHLLHSCQTWCNGGTATAGEAGVGSHSCAQVLIPCFLCLVQPMRSAEECSLRACAGDTGLWGAWPPWWPDFFCQGRDTYLSLFCCLHAKQATQPESLPLICLISLEWRNHVSWPQRCVVWAGEARAPHTHPILCDPGPCSFPSSLLSAQTCAAPLLNRPLSWWQNQSTGAIGQTLQMTAFLQIQLRVSDFFK